MRYIQLLLIVFLYLIGPAVASIINGNSEWIFSDGHKLSYIDGKNYGRFSDKAGRPEVSLADDEKVIHATMCARTSVLAMIIAQVSPGPGQRPNIRTIKFSRILIVRRIDGRTVTNERMTRDGMNGVDWTIVEFADEDEGGGTIKLIVVNAKMDASGTFNKRYRHAYLSIENGGFRVEDHDLPLDETGGPKRQAKKTKGTYLNGTKICP